MKSRSFLLAVLPEGIAAALLLAGHGPGALLLTPLLIRLAWLAAELLHGGGHTIVRALVDGDPGVLRLEHLLEHRSPQQLLQALLPLAPIGPACWRGQPPPWLAAGDPTPWKLRLKAAGGFIAHGLALAVAVAMLLQPPTAAPRPLWLGQLLVALVISNLAVALSSRSDLRSFCSGRGLVLCCGNFGVLAAVDDVTAPDLLPPEVITLFERMGRETELRGAQAGGGLVMAIDDHGDACFVGQRIVNAKRGDLTPALETAFRRRRRQALRKGRRLHPAGVLACWHYRFGTSGPPAVRETHWQEWCPPRLAHLWHQDEDGRWHDRWQTVHHRITHNGDFETLEAFGQTVDVATGLTAWLEQALQQPAPAVVDSARIAGMMDLLICQGDWFAAVRWASLITLVPFPATLPVDALEAWTERFEDAFAVQVRTATGEGWIEPLSQRLLPRLRREPLLADHDDDVLRRWIGLAAALFLQNDPYEALRQFMAHARGSFGLVVASTTRPDRLVIASLGQPITIGFDPHRRTAVYASESAAVDAVLAARPEAWRIDLDENAGELALLSSQSLRVTSLSEGQELPSETLLARLRPYSPSKPPPAASTADRDPVAADIAAIPGLVASIDDDWSHPGSSNRQTLDSLGQLFITKAAHLLKKESVLRQAGLDDSLARSLHVDLLIVGVENSLWLGEQFARDLTALLPRLTVRALSSNVVLKALQTDIDSLALARQSIVLVLSHSSRTFPSRQVMEVADLMARRGAIRELFILTGEPDSLLGSTLLAVHQPGEPFSRRLFTTAAGRRRAEPATASVAAMHHTLTQLLFGLCRQLLQAFPDERTAPLGLRLRRHDLQRLQEHDLLVLANDCSAIVGSDLDGRPRATATSRQLAQAGRQWAQHVLETPFAWLLHAVYILVSVAFGLPLVQTLLKLLAGGDLPPWGSLGGTMLREAALIADVGFYVFGPWFWTLALRAWQRRPLLARTGRRSVVVGETAWVHPLLTNYISKLFSLSFGITSLDVQGGEVGDHLLHTHAHRLVRGTLLFFGIPDGRFNGWLRAEADAALLTARQSDGIRHWDTGPEIVAVGSEPILQRGPFRQVFVLPAAVADTDASPDTNPDTPARHLIGTLRESRFGAFRRLVAGYVFFWAMARDVGRVPLLQFKWWRSQSRTRVMTTAAPVSAARLDLCESEEIAALALDNLARREQS